MRKISFLFLLGSFTLFIYSCQKEQGCTCQEKQSSSTEEKNSKGKSDDTTHWISLRLGRSSGMMSLKGISLINSIGLRSHEDILLGISICLLMKIAMKLAMELLS